MPYIPYSYLQYYPAIQYILPTLIEEINKSLIEYKEKMKIKYNTNDKSVFLHVRRGYYVGKSNYNYLQNEEYYMKAVDIIKP